MEMLNKILEGDPVSFANVRHPFERLVSAYIDKVQGQTQGKVQNKSWENFLKIVLKEVKKSPDKKKRKEMEKNIYRHTRPYNNHCSFCILKYKVISKMETFDEDRNQILDMVGLEGKKEDEKLNVHGGDKTSDLTRKYFKNISQKLKKKLLDLYKHEFALFAYQTDLF